MDLKLSLAPFRGITLKAYRTAFAGNFEGFDLFYAPFVSGTGRNRIKPSTISDLLNENESSIPCVPQYLGNDPGEMLLLAEVLHDNGYNELNWNLGCPFGRIANKKRGCGLLQWPDEIDRILENYFRSPKLKLSVKTRLGFRHGDEIAGAVQVFNRYPLKNIIIHPRTGAQRYSGKADLLTYHHYMNMSAHPVIYNGDIYSIAQYWKFKELLPGQNEWMLGRGALIDPFLAIRIRGGNPGPEEKREKLWKFHNQLWEYALENIPDQRTRTGWMKAIWHYLSGSFSESREVFLGIKTAGSDASYLEAVRKTFESGFASESQIAEHFLRLSA